MTKRSSDSGMSFEEHPLFPVEAGDTIPEIRYISVFRHENGRAVQVPRTFKPDELTSTQDIYDLWGGGTYELWGRKAANNNPDKPGWMTINRRVTVPGKSRPLVDEAASPAEVPAGTFVAAAPQAPDTSIMGMFMQMQLQMMQMQAQATERADQARREDAARSKTEQADMMKMIATLNASSQQSFVQMMTAVMTMQRQGGGTEDLGKILELLKGLGFKPPGSEEAEGAGSNMLADAADLAMALPAALGSLKGMVPPIPAGPVPPGSAGSVFKKPEGT